jgi:hypothetical protein
MRICSRRLSSFHGQPPLTTAGDNFIPLKHLIKGGVYISATGSFLTNSEVNLRKVTVGTLSEVSSNMLQYLFYIHRKPPPVVEVLLTDL